MDRRGERHSSDKGINGQKVIFGPHLLNTVQARIEKHKIPLQGNFISEAKILFAVSLGNRKKTSWEARRCLAMEEASRKESAEDWDKLDSMAGCVPGQVIPRASSPLKYEELRGILSNNIYLGLSYRTYSMEEESFDEHGGG